VAATAATVITGTSSTDFLTASTLGASITRGFTQRFDFLSTTAVTGSGAVTSAFSGFREIYLSSLATGRASFTLGSPGTVGSLGSYSDETKTDFSKKIWLSGRACVNVSSTYVGDANTYAGSSLGGYITTTTGNMNAKGIGWRKAGGSSAVVELIVHNGTTFTSVSTTKTVATLELCDWAIYSNGSGTVTLYINGVSSATTTAGPTGLGGANQCVYREQVEAIATPGVKMLMHSYGGCFYCER
jgi:hypothetical protein